MTWVIKIATLCIHCISAADKKEIIVFDGKRKKLAQNSDAEMQSNFFVIFVAATAAAALQIL